MKNKLFDEHVNNQFDNYKPNVPPHIWENIVFKKDDKKPAFLFFRRTTKMGAAFFILAISGLLIYVFGGKDVLPKPNTTSVIKNNVLVESKLINTDAQEQSTVIKNSHLLPISHSKENNNNAKVKNDEDKRKAQITNLVNNRKVLLQSSKTKNFESNVMVNNSLNKEVTENEIDGIIDDKKERNELFTSYLFALKCLEPKKNSPQNIMLPRLPKIPFIPCPEAEKNTAGNKHYVELFGGPDFIYKNYSDTTNSDYLKIRKASTGINNAYSAGLRYTKVFNNGISMRAGLNYSQINENLTAKNGFLLERVYVVNNTGDTVNSYTKSTLQYERSKNIYRSIDIPLLMGYELGNGRLHTNISIGIMVNIFSKQLGSVLDKDGKAVDITSGKTASIYQYKTNAGISVLGSVSIYYKLNDNLHLMAEPYFRYSLSSFTKPDITLKEKFHTVGLKFGLRWDL